MGCTSLLFFRSWCKKYFRKLSRFFYLGKKLRKYYHNF